MEFEVGNLWKDLGSQRWWMDGEDVVARDLASVDLGPVPVILWSSGPRISCQTVPRIDIELIAGTIGGAFLGRIRRGNSRKGAICGKFESVGLSKRRETSAIERQEMRCRQFGLAPKLHLGAGHFALIRPIDLRTGSESRAGKTRKWKCANCRTRQGP